MESWRAGDERHTGAKAESRELKGPAFPAQQYASRAIREDAEHATQSSALRDSGGLPQPQERRWKWNLFTPTRAVVNDRARAAVDVSVQICLGRSGRTQNTDCNQGLHVAIPLEAPCATFQGAFLGPIPAHCLLPVMTLLGTAWVFLDNLFSLFWLGPCLSILILLLHAKSKQPFPKGARLPSPY